MTVNIALLWELMKVLEKHIFQQEELGPPSVHLYTDSDKLVADKVRHPGQVFL